MKSQTLADITVIGPDKRGVVAGVTQAIFLSHGNIENINQNVTQGLFGMHLEASFQRAALNQQELRARLDRTARELGMEIRVHFEEPNRPKNMAIFVSREPHCLEALLQARLPSKIVCVIGTERTLAPVAKQFRIPFFAVEEKDQHVAEEKMFPILEKVNADFIVLARYMRILSPNFVWRYPNRIINIHPSLLPAFPGAYAYHQAYERGAQIIGCTAHFVTEELDQGPIIWQDSFRVPQGQSLGYIRAKGQELEARTLANAVKLYLQNRLEVIWGKVHFKKAKA